MSEILEALILGIVQGLTEFLPVSSSGHLEIVKFLFQNDKMAEQSLLTSVFLHFATALATIVVFRKDVADIIRMLFVKGWNTEKSFSVFIIISMIPATLVGFFLEDFVEQFFDNKIGFVASMLIVTGFILLLSERIHNRTRPLNGASAFIIGISQAIAVLPGISRSGATIGTALLLGVDKAKAARFSFLMVVPLIFGKMGKDLLTGDFMANAPSAGYLITGFIAAFIAGFAACTWMIQIVKRSKLSWFAGYCFIIGISILIYLLWNK